MPARDFQRPAQHLPQRADQIQKPGKFILLATRGAQLVIFLCRRQHAIATLTDGLSRINFAQHLTITRFYYENTYIDTNTMLILDKQN